MARPRSPAGRVVSGRELESLALAPDVDETSYEAAAALDDLFAKGRYSAKTFEQKVRKHHTELGARLVDMVGKKPPHLDIGWPSWLYIPGDAPYQAHWPVPAPADHRYSHEWAPPTSPAGFSTASRAAGTIYAVQRILSNASYAAAEAGLGVLYTPANTLTEITLEPDVRCSGEHRWYHEFDFPVAGHTFVRMSVILAAWHQIPGGWDLLSAKRHEVQRSGPHVGLGHGAIMPYTLSLTGDFLKAPFLVQKGRTYLSASSRASVCGRP